MIIRILDPIKDIYLSQKICEFKFELPLSQTEEHNLRQRCKELPMSLHKQLKQILPDNLTVLKNLFIFSATNVLQPSKNLTKYSNVMEYLGISGNILAKAESQLQSINL